MSEAVRTEAELLAMLDSPNPVVQREAAASAHATESVLMKALDIEPTDWTLALAACHNPRATEAVVMKAYHHPYMGHQTVAAGSPYAPADMLREAIKRNEEPHIQYAASRNESAPTDALLAAMTDMRTCRFGDLGAVVNTLARRAQLIPEGLDAEPWTFDKQEKNGYAFVYQRGSARARLFRTWFVNALWFPDAAYQADLDNGKKMMVRLCFPSLAEA